MERAKDPRAGSTLLGLLVVSVLVVLSLPGAALGATPRDCTFKGGPGPDFPPVTDKRDVLCTGAGNDVIRPSAGNDIIFSGSGRDLVYGGTGRDLAYGGGGGDLLDGGGGNDRLYGGSGSDTIRGSAGFDRLWGGPGADALDGGDDTHPDVLQGGPGADRAARHPDDVVKSAVLGYTICVTEWIPCITSNNYLPVRFNVTNKDDCGGSNGPTDMQDYIFDQWNCGGYTGSFDYVEPTTGDSFYVYTYTPEIGIFKDPYLVCALPNYETAGAGTPVPTYTCVPDFTGNGEWPFAQLYLLEQDDPSYGLGAGQTCTAQTPGALTSCPGIGDMQASNSGSVWILNNASSSAEISFAVNGVPYLSDTVGGGETLIGDIKAGATVMLELPQGQTATAQIMVTQVLSWGHDSVDALGDD